MIKGSTNKNQRKEDKSQKDKARIYSPDYFFLREAKRKPRRGNHDDESTEEAGAGAVEELRTGGAVQLGTEATKELDPGASKEVGARASEELTPDLRLLQKVQD